MAIRIAVNRALIFGHQSRCAKIAGMIFNGFVRLFLACGFRTRSAASKRLCVSALRSFSSSNASSDSVSIPKFCFSPNVRLTLRRNANAAEPDPRGHVVRDSLLMFFGLIYIAGARQSAVTPSGLRQNSNFYSFGFAVRGNRPFGQIDRGHAVVVGESFVSAIASPGARRAPAEQCSCSRIRIVRFRERCAR